MKQALSVWLLILFVILAMGIAGNMELADREAADQPDVVVASE